MVRSVGIAAVVLGLAWTGLATAQSSSPLGVAAPRERYITVREEGRPPQRCKLLKSWQEPNGVPAFQVQAVDTGEMMTIVGSGPPADGGGRRAMSTRIFRWGSANKPPAGAPVPPPTAQTMAAPPAPSAPPKATPSVTLQAPPPAAQPSTPTQLAPTPRPTPTALTARKPDVPSAPPVAALVPVQPSIPPPPVTSSKPAPSAGAAQPDPIVRGNPLLLTPMSTQVIQPSPVPKLDPHGSTPSAPPQPRLVPTAGGTAVSQTPGPCGCPAPCDACCQPCNPCAQRSCVCCTPSPMRQSFISRLFKSHPPCDCTEVACQPAPAPAPAPTPPAANPPAPAVAKIETEPAKPRDWRESWGKVEPWKDTAKTEPAKPVEKVTQRANPAPVPLDAPKQPDPLKDPNLYRDMALNARPANSKIPEESQPAAPSRPKNRLFSMLRPTEPKTPAPPPEHPIAAEMPPPSVGAMPEGPAPVRSPGRVVQLPADEPNAFWSPPQSPKRPAAGQEKSPAEGQENPKNNAFDRDENTPPPPPGTSPRIAPGYAGPLPPPGPMQPPQPLVPSRPDMGVPDAMGNAFTLPGTRRPIPADFGGTPQEPNGFDPMVRGGQGSPPQAYGMGMPATPRPPMSNMVAMGPRAPMMGNPLMNVPSAPVAPGSAIAAAHRAGVPQLLATLKDSLYPSERESAAEQLSELNWRVQPQVVESLMKSARDDPAATVRAACVHALARMKANSAEVTALVQNLKSDRDPRVRQEAEEALNALGGSGIQQASHR